MVNITTYDILIKTSHNMELSKLYLFCNYILCNYNNE